MKLLDYLNRQSRGLVIVIDLSLTIFLCFLDYLSGPDIAFAFFYLFPISLAAWFLGKREGIIISIVSSAALLLPDFISGRIYFHPAIPFWNIIVRLGVFLVVTYILAGLKASREREKELNQFIIHDLRSPLGNVMSGLSIMKDNAEETGDTEQSELVELCQESCNRILTLINSLLDLDRLESGKMQLKLQEVNVRKLIESAVAQVKVMASTNKIVLNTSVDENIHTVKTDFDLTLRVIVNLLSNAIKFSNSDSAVNIKVTKQDNKGIVFSVADKGRGIPPEWLDKVFDKFTQVESNKSGTIVTGSGIGLTFCSLAVKSLGGNIWLKSKIDEGTTISFTLPPHDKSYKNN
ncbi:MAG: hypothetical protein C4539_11830 [Ignavibacteriales bacterium]|nr:MAG: hypothetical protein C4539_11830 [Ignavibacteriales bacterium]